MRFNGKHLGTFRSAVEGARAYAAHLAALRSRHSTASATAASAPLPSTSSAGVGSVAARTPPPQATLAAPSSTQASPAVIGPVRTPAASSADAAPPGSTTPLAGAGLASGGNAPASPSPPSPSTGSREEEAVLALPAGAVRLRQTLPRDMPHVIAVPDPRRPARPPLTVQPAATPLPSAAPGPVLGPMAAHTGPASSGPTTPTRTSFFAVADATPERTGSSCLRAFHRHRDPSLLCALRSADRAADAASHMFGGGAPHRWIRIALLIYNLN